MTFQAYLVHTRARDNSTGDFIRDARQCSRTHAASILTLGDLLDTLGPSACAEARRQAAVVWRGYQRYLRQVR